VTLEQKKKAETRHGMYRPFTDHGVWDLPLWWVRVVPMLGTSCIYPCIRKEVHEWRTQRFFAGMVGTPLFLSHFFAHTGGTRGDGRH
jgi:hypothetical protein